MANFQKIAKPKKIQAAGLDEITRDDINLITTDDDILEILEFQPWFDYELAKEIFIKLGRMYDEAIIDKEIRPLSYFICGDINSGKTTLVTRFRNIMEKRHGYKEDDVRYYEVPVRATLKRVFAGILTLFGEKITGNALRNVHTQDLVDMIIERLERNKVKVLFIDELQDLVVASPDDKKAIFTGFKKILNNCSTRLVLIGTTNARDLLYLDEWIDERLVVIDIPLWEDGEPFRELLAKIYKAYKPFVPDWDLFEVKEGKIAGYNYPVILLLLEISSGRLGKLLQIIRYVIIETIQKGQTNISVDDYQDIFNSNVKYEIKNGAIVKKVKNRDESVENQDKNI
ncbi:MAG: TniB family NTP-binding protein [Candidatus Odinarchaeota archaeon]